MSSFLPFFLSPLAPVILPFLASVGLIAAECFPRLVLHRTKFLMALAGALGSLIFTFRLWKRWPIPFVTESYGQGERWLVEFTKAYHLDPFVLALFVGIAVFTLITIILLESYFHDSEVRSEVFSLTLIVSSGMMLLVSANTLVMVFLALELLSLPTYVLVGIQRKDIKSGEAALKYFLFGSFATVLLVLSIALLYGAFGTMDLSRISELIRGQSATGTKPGAVAGIVLFLVTLAFKVGAVPFHMWVPDAYEGAPTPVTGFMGSAVKLAAFGLALRIFWGAFAPLSDSWVSLVGWIAVITMFVGNLAALLQDNLKRLFAYSSISHAGYLLVAVASVGVQSSEALSHIYYYLLVYGLMFIGLFGTIMLLEQTAKSTDIFTLSGLGFTQPVLGGCIALFSLSAAGIPPLAGFFAKYFIFLDAVKAGHTPLVVAGVISSLIGAYFYLRILVYLYMREARHSFHVSYSTRLVKFAVFACAASLVYFAFSPLMSIGV